MILTRQALCAVCFAAGWAAAIPSCGRGGDVADVLLPLSSQPGAGNTTGTIELALAVDDATIDFVEMKIYAGSTSSGVPIISTPIDVRAADAGVSAFVGALEAGNYTVTFDATSSTSSVCFGEDAFTIVPGTTTTKLVTISCGISVANPRTGQFVATIQATVASCPYLANLEVSPLETSGVISLSTAVVTPAAGPRDLPSRVEWKEGATTLVTGNTGTFDCGSSAPGVHTITATLTKPGTACTESISVDVTCT